MLEELLREAEEENIKVIPLHLRGNIKGLYCDSIIALSNDISTAAEKTCILAEELGHYHTTVGNILDQSKVRNRKQERQARGWAYERLVSLKSLVYASKHGIRNRYELAEYLGVSESFIDGAIQYYREKYGAYYKLQDYTIYFEPLGVLKKL